MVGRSPVAYLVEVGRTLLCNRLTVYVDVELLLYIYRATLFLYLSLSFSPRKKRKKRSLVSLLSLGDVATDNDVGQIRGAAIKSLSSEGVIKEASPAPAASGPLTLTHSVFSRTPRAKRVPRGHLPLSPMVPFTKADNYALTTWINLSP